MMSSKSFLSSLFTYFQFLSPLAYYLGGSLMSFSDEVFFPLFFSIMIDMISFVLCSFRLE